MNSEYKQTFNYARITVYKNYSNLNKKCIIYDSDNSDDFDWMDEPLSAIESDESADGAALASVKKFVVSAVVTESKTPTIANLNLYRKNNRSYFYTTAPTKKFKNHALKGAPEIECDPIKLVNAKTITASTIPEYFETDKDRQIKGHYYKPFSHIEIYKIDRWIKREGDKVTIKQFSQVKTRKVNSRYFKKNTHSTTVTFDMVKGNFRIIKYESHKKKKTKHFYTNSFSSLEQALPEIFKINHYTITKRSPLYDSFIQEFDDYKFKDSLSDIIMGVNRVSELGYDTYAKDFIAYWMPKFAELKRIKLPDNGFNLLKIYYPTERYLKKNNRKLVAAILDRLGILSKVTVRILHQHSHVELRTLMKLCKLLGENYTKYLGNIDDKFFARCGTPGNNPFDAHGIGFRHLLIENVIRNRYDLSNTEKENIVHILNDMSSIHTAPVHGAVDQFYDHFVMRDRLRQYYPELSLNVTKWHSFSTEHSRYSAMERNIKKGYSTHLVFEKHVREAIEQPIEYVVLDEPPLMYLPDPKDQRAYEKEYAQYPISATKYVFTPKLLTSSEEYSDEGAHMHHCVAGYIDYSRSIIISLRNQEERVTCEYDTTNRKCIQARFFSNANPPAHYEKALKALNDRIRAIPESIKPRDKRLVPLLINGKPIIPQTEEEVGVFALPGARDVGNRPLRADERALYMWGEHAAVGGPRHEPRLINNVDDFRDIFGEPDDLG